jgi:hypothetical protein
MAMTPDSNDETHHPGEDRDQDQQDQQQHRRHRHGHGRRRRHERVLHTRISEELSEDIRRFAEDLRVPASNLVRNVLEEVFSVVETVSENMGELFDDLLEEADGARDRIHRQMERHGQRRSRQGRHRHHGRHGQPADASDRGRGGRGRRFSEEDIEQELRSDEQAESGGSHASAEPKEFPDVLGWQPLVLNRAQACADCGVQLQKGDRAFLGVTSGGLSEIALCSECVRA